MANLGFFETKCTPGGGHKRVGHCANFFFRVQSKKVSGFKYMIFAMLGIPDWVASAAADPHSRARIHKAACTVEGVLFSCGCDQCLSTQGSHACSLSQGHHMKRAPSLGSVAKGGAPRFLSHAFLDTNRVDR